MTDGLTRAAPDEVGVSAAAVLRFLDDLEAHGVEMNSFMLCRHGRIAAEGWWWPYAPERVHMMHSVTKALTSTGVGLAVAEGRFRLADPVTSFFPGSLPETVSPNLAAMTVEHLVSQTCGHEKGISGSIWRRIRTSWIDEFFKVPVPYVPGSRFTYSSATSFMLSAIVTRTTGQSLHDYLKPRLLEPLGMDSLRWDVGPEGINPGGNGVSATTAELMKLVACHAAGGRWNGRQLIPEAWIAQAGTGKFGNPYGYHWWMAPDGSGYFAFGAFGQYGFVFPALDAVMVTTAAVPGSISRPDQLLPPLVWKHVPEMCRPAPADPAATARLRERTAALRLLQPLVASSSPLAAMLGGRRFVAGANEDGVVAIQVDIAADRCLFTLENGSGVHRVEAGFGDWVEGSTSMPGAGLHHGYEPPALRVVAGAEWLEPNLLELRCQFVETAFRDTIRLRFDGAGVAYDRSVNVNGAGTVRPQIRAMAAS